MGLVTDATTLARHLVAQWLLWDVEHVVLCPGSRSAPLAFAVHEAAEQGRLTLHTRIDERSAAYLALGIAKVTHEPAVVITTSGTAAANLHPAVLEASHAGIPLVAVTADRPSVLRGTGANQTTDQVRLFGDAAISYDISSAHSIDKPWDEPVHLNVQFTEPLTPHGSSGWLAEANAAHTPPERDAPILLDPGPRTVVVAGDDAGRRARQLAEKANWPLLAEPTSGSRTGDHAIRSYRLLLGGELGDRVERVVVFGHPTLSRPVTRLLANKEVVSVRTRGRWAARPFSVLAEHDAVDVLAPEPTDWLDEWRAADREISAQVDRIARADFTPYAVAAAVHAALPPGGLLYVGASNPIRDLDLMARPTGVGERRYTIANRGLAGIDGVVSSAIGAALARENTRAICYLGDVSFLHDMGALVLGPREQRPDLTIVVANDDGGSIFSVLEQGAPEFADSFDTLFGTPHGVDLAQLCAATRTPHWRVDNLAELEHALASPNGGVEVIEAVIRRDNRRELDEMIKGLIDH